MNSFSSFNRQHTITKLKESEFDLLIIGGGITGAGIALDAASRGMKVALIEKK
jgi:glycerol-3-phosphate dehydrogenase